ncbi:mitochondrial proton/calcium exchanger protein-like protein isoform X1 [Tanacetum coccineum]
MNPSYQNEGNLGRYPDKVYAFDNRAKRHDKTQSEPILSIDSTDAAIRNQGASIKTLEIQIRQMSKVQQERGFGSLPSSTETNPRDHVNLISIVVEADSYPIRRIGPFQYAVSTGQYPKEKDPESFTLPCFINNVCFNNALADLGASVSVMPLSTYPNLGLGELARTKLTVELADRTVKYPKGIAENVLVGKDKLEYVRNQDTLSLHHGNQENRKEIMKKSRKKFRERKLVPSCCVIFDFDPLSLSIDFVFDFEISKSFPCLS